MNDAAKAVIEWAVANEDDCVRLLGEWMRWWAESDEAPAKVAGGLHVETITWLAALRFDETPGRDLPRLDL